MTDTVEFHGVTSYDGLEYDLQDDFDHFVLTEGGPSGFAPQRFFTRRTYKGDGEIEIDDPRFDPRDFTLSLHVKNECSRSAFWSNRRDLLNVLRPNRGGPVTYNFILADGSRRSLRGRPITPLFEPTMEAGNWNFTVDLQFRCFDPIWFDPDSGTCLTVQDASPELVFPITFDDDDIWFGAEGYYGECGINYVGTWYSYPTFYIEGPCTTVEIVHVEKAISVFYLHQINAGDYITLDFPNRSFTDQDGNKIILGSMSHIYDMRLEPDPVLANGVNTFQFNLPGATGATVASISYNARYEGI